MKWPIPLILIVAFILAVVGIAYYVSWPPVPDTKFRQVKPGMAGEAVRELLGLPTHIDSDSNNAALGVSGTNWASQWIYERELPWSTAWVYVMFTNGSVSRISGDRFP